VRLVSIAYTTAAGRLVTAFYTLLVDTPRHLRDIYLDCGKSLPAVEEPKSGARAGDVLPF
jgi:hypothetical protein